MKALISHLCRHCSIYFFFLLSGATGLVYELIWVRLLGLHFGNTIYAISLVLATFMGGLAIGGYIVSHYLDTHPRPLRLYALLEIGIGIWALLAPVLLEWVNNLYVMLFPLLGSSLLFSSLLRFGMSSLILLVPTIMMGGTLPALTTHFTKQLGQMGEKLTFLYALNTLGAVIGTWWVGFYALPWLGISLTNTLAVLVNLTIGMICLLFDYQLLKLPADPPITTQSTPDTNRVVSRLMIAVIFVAGFSAMIYEIAWTRSLVMVLGNSTYAFSCILIAFLLGIFLGSQMHSRMRKTFPVRVLDFGLVELLVGTTCLLTLPAFNFLPEAYLSLYTLLPRSNWSIQVLRLLLPLSVMIVPTIFMGVAFPMACEIYSRAVGHISSGVGNIYGANTLGNVFGALLGGFFLLRYMGAQNTLKMAIILNLSVGVVVILFSKYRYAKLLAGTALFMGVLVILHSPWDKYILDSGISVYTRNYDPTKPFESLLKGSEILFHKEGISGITSVYQKPNGQRVLKVNGKDDASSKGVDMYTQSLLGYLPLFLHPDPQNALVIGLGSGVTSSVVAQYDFIEQVDCVEIEPAVVEATKFFKRVNRDILQNPRVNIIVDDGRSHLQLSSKTYDLIISEPSNPWIKGIGNLFTVDFYDLCRRRLNHGGIMCQWIQAYGLTPKMFAMAVNSFRQSFDYSQLWYRPPTDTFIIGSNEPITIDLERIDKMMNYNKQVRSDMKRYLSLDSPFGLLAYFQLNNEEIAELTKGAGLNTDNYPMLEFDAPRCLLTDTSMLNYKNITSYKKDILPLRLLGADRQINLAEYYYSLSKVCLMSELIPQASRYIDMALERNDKDSRFYLVRGKINAWKKNYYQAIAALKRSLELDSENYETHLELARTYRKIVILPKAQVHFQRAFELSPQDEELRYDYAMFLAFQRKEQQALSLAKGLTSPRELDPFKVWMLIGDIYNQMKDFSEARVAYEKSLQMNGANYGVKKRLGKMDLAQGKIAKALERFLEINKSYYSPNIDLLNLISDCYIHLQQYDNAADILREILKRKPDDLKAYKKLTSLPIDQTEDIF